MNAYRCWVCEAVGPEPCEDVIEFAALPAVRSDGGSSPLRTVLACEGMPVDPAIAVPFLVAQPCWPAVVDEAREHVLSDCNDCNDCLPLLAVLQVEQFFWATREQLLADS